MKSLYLMMRVLIVLGLLATINACIPEDDGKPTAYTWEVYAANEGCECKAFDSGNAADWDRVTTLLRVDYGFTLSNGKVVVKSDTLVPTPWHKVDFAPQNIVAVELYAQSAESVILVCVIYQGALELGAFGGTNPGTCTGAVDD